MIKKNENINNNNIKYINHIIKVSRGDSSPNNINNNIRDEGFNNILQGPDFSSKVSFLNESVISNKINDNIVKLKYIKYKDDKVIILLGHIFFKKNEKKIILINYLNKIMKSKYSQISSKAFEGKVIKTKIKIGLMAFINLILKRI